MKDEPDVGGGASRSTEAASGTSTATDVSLREYFWALRDADQRFFDERDRRYAEVALEREKALKIKEEADKAALGLAREIQTYKDEKANELREQISSERGLYATKGDVQAAVEKIEATLKPLIGTRAQGINASAGVLATIAALAISVVTIAVYVLTH
jgi:vacuolar-type H+-ATPase subunit H